MELFNPLQLSMSPFFGDDLNISDVLWILMWFVIIAGWSGLASLWSGLVFTAPLPLLLLSSNFLNCKCRGKCNPILKQVPSKLERPSFLSELTCGKYLSIFHIWIYASSLLLRVWFVAQKTFKTCQTLLRQMDDFLHAVDRQLLFLTMISC